MSAYSKSRRSPAVFSTIAALRKDCRSDYEGAECLLARRLHIRFFEKFLKKLGFWLVLDKGQGIVRIES